MGCASEIGRKADSDAREFISLPGGIDPLGFGCRVEMFRLESQLV